MQQAQIGDLEPLARRLEHVVDGQGRHRAGGQGLHLHPCLGLGLHRGADVDEGLLGVELELYLSRSDGKWVAQWDQLARLLGCHDARELGHAQRVALAHSALLQGLHCLGAQPDRSFSRRRAQGRGLFTHIHHAGFAVFKVGQFAHSKSLALMGSGR
ncbi:Uncharacterised protein [Acinetobacter baumannii]|nr:Uncharacterised protein [Acinetobacter baumannii]